MDRIVELVLQETGTTLEDLSSSKMYSEAMDARIVICYICIKKGYTLAQIASKINISTTAVYQTYLKFNRQNKRYIVLEYIRKRVEERY